ncbi:MAG: SMI1/KNR4 family protein [Planctomycetota bacterium]
MSQTLSIAKIQELFDSWREMGSVMLSSGAELIASYPYGDETRWMHALFPGLDTEHLKLLEADLGQSLPRQLRAFLRGCGGLTLFQGMFSLYGLRQQGFVASDAALQPESLVELNRGMQAVGRLEPGWIAFAQNALDSSIYVTSTDNSISEVRRIELGKGEVIERHSDIFACIESRLYRLDEFAM